MPLQRNAVISDCGDYRYLLTRQLTLLNDPPRILLFVMLNPSVADAQIDDNTIRRCIAFATQHGYSEMRVVNLFAYRSTDPADLKRAGYLVGPANDSFISTAAAAATTVCCAWGKLDQLARNRANVVRGMLAMYHRKPLMCLGKTKDGIDPRHPLYLAGNTPLQVL